MTVTNSSEQVSPAGIGVVVIGRNEGERLRRCLESLRALSSTLVYVDSASIDGSVELAQRMHADVVALDMSIPFTAARARNAGFNRLAELASELAFVQFVDGDCEIVDGWLERAGSFLRQRPDVACVCGRLRERFPERSVYNRLCDIEWDRPAGETDSCGGILMARITAFRAANGFREDMIAGEEPELCSRLRRQGWKIWRLADGMAWHDAAILHFRQWWKRTQRTGFGYAQSIWMQAAAGGEKLQSRRALSAWIWAGALPLAIALACWGFGLPALALLLAYPAQVVRTAAKVPAPRRQALERAFFLVLGRFPELIGQLQFWARRRSGRKPAPSFDYKA